MNAKVSSRGVNTAPPQRLRSRLPVHLRFMAEDADSIETKFGRRVTVMPNGCWAYNGELDLYGQFCYFGVSGEAQAKVPAHRFAYETLVGPIPDGHHVHHECEHRGCVNPAHLIALAPGDHHRRHAEMRQANSKPGS